MGGQTGAERRPFFRTATHPTDHLVFLLNQIHNFARASPDKLAIGLPDQPISYAEFWQMISAARSAVQPLLPGRGVVLLAVQNPADVWILAIAVRSLGLDVAVIPKQASTALFDDVEPVSVIALDDESVSSTPPDGQVTRLTLRAPSSQFGRSDGPLPELPAVDSVGGQYLVTSGTTGQHKKVLWMLGDRVRPPRSRMPTHTVLTAFGSIVLTAL